jgi:farnesyl diphosphate synthase
MMNNTIKTLIAQHDNVLQHLIQQMDVPAPRIKEAMTYSLFPGGKRLRPLLVYLCGKLIKVPTQSLDIIAAAIEMTHCYSLIHDDLPAMDNDDMRRGKPSCHRAFDEATAILTGDALQIAAMDILLTHLPSLMDMSQVVQVTLELAKASGASGMISGQSLDLSELAHHKKIPDSDLRKIHDLKTGRLILACINMVIAAGKPSKELADSLRDFAINLGLVFQMQDDFMDHYQNNENTLGKGRASDSANEKTTFATLYNEYELTNLIAQHYQQANDALTIFADHANDLCDLTSYLYYRTVTKRET